MKLNLGRLAALVGVAATAALVSGPATASAVTCSSFTGAGSSLQKISQTGVWGPGWKTAGFPSCETGSNPTFTYFTSSSGKGKEQWGSVSMTLEKKPTSEEPQFPSFIGTDVAASTTQEANIEKAGGTSVVTVPVEQSAVTFLIDLPEGCVPLTTTAAPAVTLEQVQEVWEGTLKFSQFITPTTASKTKCEVAPTLRVRSSSSGTTATWKRFLGCIKHGPCSNVNEAAPWKARNAKLELSENIEWPATVATSGSSGGELVTSVAANAGSVGYADLADARENALFKTTEWTESATTKSWDVIAKIKVGTESISPEVTTEKGKGASNCAATEYGPYPKSGSEIVVGPKDSYGETRGISVNEEGKTYPACTVTYDLAWHEYEKPESAGSKVYTEGEYLSVLNYLKWIVGTGATEGQKIASLTEKHYAPLPSALVSPAKNGVNSTNIKYP